MCMFTDQISVVAYILTDFRLSQPGPGRLSLGDAYYWMVSKYSRSLFHKGLETICPAIILPVADNDIQRYELAQHLQCSQGCHISMCARHPLAYVLFVNRLDIQPSLQ
ncbi:hypothetical protein HRR85_003183 [Exophiala dermatitidis]|nr:hypothetical protein HRR85_003183 [Exophiala dermatitidis]